MADTVGGVSIRDYAALNSVATKSIQALAFGEFTRSGVVYSNGQTIGLATDANNILSTTTARAQATGTYRVPFGQYAVVQYLTTTTTNVFNTNYLYFVNEFPYDPYAASENLLSNATVNVSVSTTASGTTSSVTGLAFVGDGGAVSTSQAINGPITSTGPLGDVYLGRHGYHRQHHRVPVLRHGRGRQRTDCLDLHDPDHRRSHRPAHRRRPGGQPQLGWLFGTTSGTTTTFPTP